MKNFLKKYDIYCIAVIASMIVSLIIFAWQQPIDTDAIGYFGAARAFLDGGIKAANAVYPWPLYSIILAFLSKVFHVSFLSASNGLNVFLDTIVVLVFIKLLSLFGASKREMFFGLFFILFFPYLAHFRHMPMRDHGYLAFSLCSAWFLIEYYREGRAWQSILWGFFIILATLFRVEGAIYIILAPVVIIFNVELKFFQRLKRMLGAYVIPIVAIIFAVCVVFFKKHQVNQAVFNNYLGRISDLKMGILSGAQISYDSLSDKARLIAPIVAINQVPLAFVFLTYGLAGLYLRDFFNLLPVLYFLLGIAGLYQLIVIKKQKGMAVVFMFIMIGLVISVGVITRYFFLSKRYILLLSIFILLGAPFSFQVLLEKWRNKSGRILGSRWFFPLVVLWLGIIVLSSVVYFGPSKTFVIRAGDWLHDHVPAEAVLCHNDAQVNFYANLQKTNEMNISQMNEQTLPACDYLSVTLVRSDKTAQEMLNVLLNGKSPEIIFEGRRGGKTMIYKLK